MHCLLRIYPHYPCTITVDSAGQEKKSCFCRYFQVKKLLRLILSVFTVIHESPKYMPFCVLIACLYVGVKFKLLVFQHKKKRIVCIHCISVRSIRNFCLLIKLIKKKITNNNLTDLFPLQLAFERQLFYGHTEYNKCSLKCIFYEIVKLLHCIKN